MGELRFVFGWVLLHGERPPGRSVRLRATDARAGSTLAEAVSLPDGQFAVVVPLDSADDSVLIVEAMDSAGDVLARQEVPGDRPMVLALPRELPEERPSGPALLTGAAADLAGRVARLEASGHLPAGALDVLDAALGRFAWLDGLLEPAQRAILGDPSAAAVVREALGAWAREIPRNAAAPVNPTSPGGEDRRDDTPDGPEGLVSVDAVGTLFSAILTAGRTLDEQIEMADGLSAVMSARPWLEALARTAAFGDVPAMQVLLGTTGPIPKDLSGLGGPPVSDFPVEGLGRRPTAPFPAWPDGYPNWKPKGPRLGSVPPTIADVVERFRSPVMLRPSKKHDCLITASIYRETLQASAPVYRITGLAPANACPGTTLTITGRNFGRGGSVVFPGTAAPIPNTKAIEWTDGQIRVVVPNGAAPGLITLNILVATLVQCGQVFTVFRTGGSDVAFEGGTAAVTAFLLDGTKDPLRVDPGQVVSISCDVTTHPQAKTQVFVTRPGVTVADFGTLAGGGHRQHDFTAPSATGPVTYTVHLLVSGPCPNIESVRTLTVAATPQLRVAFIEVTQGLQNSAHTVRLVAGRTTGVRAYLTSGLGGFSYTGTPGEVPRVTGMLLVERGGVVVGTFAATKAVTVGATFADADRSGAARALVFEVPGPLMDGDVTMRVNAQAAGLPGFGTDAPMTSGSRVVRAERVGKLVVTQLRMGLTNPAHPMAVPTEVDWLASANGTRDRFPLGDADMWVAKPATGDVLSTNHYLGKRADGEVTGWEDALDDLDDYADIYNDREFIFACVVPAAVPQGSFGAGGIGHAAGLFNKRCFLAQSRFEATFAHEMAHTLGVGHAPCADPGKALPKGLDLTIFIGGFLVNLPAATEPGVVGWRRLTDIPPPFGLAPYGKLMPPGWPELMSYCTPTGLSYDIATNTSRPGVRDDRWPSVALWNMLLNKLT